MALRITAGQNASGVGVRAALETKLLAQVIGLRQGARDLVERIRPVGDIRLSRNAKGHAEPVTLLPLNRASVQSSSVRELQQDLALVMLRASADHQPGVLHRVDHLTDPGFADA